MPTSETKLLSQAAVSARDCAAHRGPGRIIFGSNICVGIFSGKTSSVVWSSVVSWGCAWGSLTYTLLVIAIFLLDGHCYKLRLEYIRIEPIHSLWFQPSQHGEGEVHDLHRCGLVTSLPSCCLGGRHRSMLSIPWYFTASYLALLFEGTSPNIIIDQYISGITRKYIYLVILFYFRYLSLMVHMFCSPNQVGEFLCAEQEPRMGPQALTIPWVTGSDWGWFLE